MKKGILKKLSCLLLIFAMAMTTMLVTDPVEAKAASDYDVTTVYQTQNDVEAGYAGVEKKNVFTVTENDGVVVYLLVDVPASGTLKLYNSTGIVLDTAPFTTTNFSYQQFNGFSAYVAYYPCELKDGDYAVGITFDTDTPFLMVIQQQNVKATMSQTKMTLTAGFTGKLSVSGGTVKSWTSKNKSIATVDKKGKVTAKKAGNTTIVATLANGEKLTCKVKVAANKYKDTKLTTGNCPSGDVYCKVYTANFDKNGNLVVKASCVNNYYYAATGFKNIKIVVKDAKGKTVATHKVSKLSTSLSTSSAKTLTFTIKKSALKNKKIDLRNATIKIDGTYLYRY